MMGKELRGMLVATGFVFGVVVGQIILTRNISPSWTETLHPPFNVLIVLVPIAVLTFFAARRIPIRAGSFGLLAFLVSFFTLAFVFGFRGLDDSLDVPVIFAVVYAITFLSGFIGQELYQEFARHEHES